MSLKTDINRTKQRLIKKAQQKGLYENFGQIEVDKIKDKHHYLDLNYGTPEQRRLAELIDNFDNWCMNYTGS